MSPFQPADREVAKGRLTKAIEFADAAYALENDSNQRNSYVSLAVLSSIASADVICIDSLKGHAKGGSHNEAVKFLAEIDHALANKLKRLLSIKTTVEYTDKSASNADVKTAQSTHLSLLDRAKQAMS